MKQKKQISKTKNKLRFYLDKIKKKVIMYIYLMAGTQLLRLLTTIKAKRDDCFTMREGPDRQVNFIYNERTNSFTVMPCTGFESGTFSLEADSPIHHTAWSTDDLYQIYKIKSAGTFLKTLNEMHLSVGQVHQFYVYMQTQIISYAFHQHIMH